MTPTRLADTEVEPLEAAYQRCAEVGCVAEFLRRAAAEPEWKAAVEAAISQKRILGGALTGGSKVADVWRKSLLHDRVVRLLQTDPQAFRDFCLTNPRVSALESAPDKPKVSILKQYEPADRVLVAHACFPDAHKALAQSMQALCDLIEANTAAPEPIEQHAEPQVADPADSAVVKELERSIRELESQVAAQKKDIKALRADLRKRETEISRKDRLVAKHREQATSAEGRAAAAEAQAREHWQAHEEAKREINRLKSRVRENQSGKRTIEDKAAAESDRLQAALAEQRERLRAGHTMQQALEMRVATLGAELERERGQRATLEQAFQVFGIDDLAGSARNLQSTLEQLQRFQQGILAYAREQAEQEHERREIEVAAEAQRTAAEAARRQQAEAEQAWDARERARLKEREDALFPNGQIDHIIIDGHNLILRSRRPDSEKSTREWLEKMVGHMARRLEARGWDARIHLAFDTPHSSNTHGSAHGVTVYFCNNTHEGGADARIQAILEEGNPAARYMVISTDHKHVWTDTLEHMRASEVDVDLVEVAMLAQYLQTLDEVGPEEAGH